MKLNWIDRICPLCRSDVAGSRVFVEANINPDQLDAFAFASRKLPEHMHPRLVECAGCRMLYANPSLSVETLATAYEEAQFDSGEEAEYASRTYAAHIRALCADLP